MIVDSDNFPATHRELLEEWNEVIFTWGDLVVHRAVHDATEGQWHLVSQTALVDREYINLNDTVPYYHRDSQRPFTLYAVYYDESTSGEPSSMWVVEADGSTTYPLIPGPFAPPMP